MTAADRGTPQAVLVTGGGTGIGAATARMLAESGHQVAVCGRRREPLDRVAAGTRDVVAVVADVGKPDEASHAVEQTVAAFGRLDGVVLNAGVIRPGAVADIALEDWEAMLSTNLTGSFLVAKAALPHLLASKGAVVSVASVAALRASSEMSAYCAAKAGLVLLTQSIAVDYGPYGVRANAVCPGWVRTEMADEEMGAFGADRGISPEDAYGLVTGLVPQRRPADPEEVAAAIVWLISPAASYVNGAVLAVDGGAAAVDVGTIAFDPAVSVARSGPALRNDLGTG